MEAGDALRRNLLAVRNASSWGRSSDYAVGSYNGLPLTAASEIGSGGERMVVLSVAGLEAVPIARLSLSQLREGQGTVLGLMTRVDNFTHSLSERAENLVGRAAQNRAEVTSMQARIGQPFSREGELNAWTAKVERLRAKIQRDDARSEGADIPFDPRIDSDQYDDPSTRASAETYVPPPEIQPASMEVLATSLMLGDSITIVLGEVSGTTGDGKIIAKRQAGGLTFITVEIDGVEYVRAYSADALVTKVGTADSITGVKGMTFARTLSVKDGKVVVQIKRINLWKEDLHPRDRNGRFIEKFASVQIWGGGTGTVLAMVKGGRVRVKRDADQREVVLDAGNVTVVAKAPGSEGSSLRAPQGTGPSQRPADGPAKPTTTADFPEYAALAPGTMIRVDRPNNTAGPMADDGAPGARTAEFLRVEDGQYGMNVVYKDPNRSDGEGRFVPKAGEKPVTSGDAPAADPAAAPDAAAPPVDAPAAPEVDPAAAADPNAPEAAEAQQEDRSVDEVVAEKAPSGTTPADMAPEAPAATFTGPNGVRAFLDTSEGEPAGYISTGDDEGTLLRFNDSEEWAETVDALNMTEDGGRRRGPAPRMTTDRGRSRDSSRQPPCMEPVAPEDAIDPAMDPLDPAAPPTAAVGAPDTTTDDDDMKQPGTYVPPADGPLTVEQVMATHDQPGRPDGAGTIEDPIDVQGDLDKAATLLGEGKHVRLNKVEEVSIILEKLSAIAQEAEAAGEKAPEVDLCTITVPGTNLFCQQSQGIPRSQMPQLSGTPVPGSPADSMERNKRGRVNVTQAFLDRLEAEGIGVTEQEVPASSLKATQNQLNGAKVGAMMVAMRDGTMTDAPVFTTRDGYVLDGHHRWAAKVGVDAEDGELGDVTQPVRMLDMEIGEALDFANAFSAEIGIQQAGVGEMNATPGAPGAPGGADMAEVRPDMAGTAKIGDTVGTLVASVGLVPMDTDDNTDLPDRLEQAAEEYDAAMESGDVRAKADAFLHLQKTLTELNNALDTGGDEPERVTALNDFATVVALFDANVPSIFPPAGAGGTDPGLEGKVLPDGVVSDFFSNAGSEDIVDGGSAAAFLIKGTDGKYRLTAERQALHDSIVGSVIDEVPVSDDPRYNFFGGGPASGKGGITRMFPQLEEDAAYINPDDMKFVLPEMAPRVRSTDVATKRSASSFVHEESSYLAKVTQAAAFDKGVNVTLDGTGDSSVDGVRKKIAGARAKGYSVDAYYVSAPIEVAVERAEWRAANGKGSDRGRAVPRKTIEHTHMAVSEIVPQVADEFDTFVLFDTNVDFGRPPNMLARKEREQRLEIMFEGGWQEFLDKARYKRPTGSAKPVPPVDTPTIDPPEAEAPDEDTPTTD